jgi:hypothetical protein
MAVMTAWEATTAARVEIIIPGHSIPVGIVLKKGLM